MMTLNDAHDVIVASINRGETPVSWRLRPAFHEHILDTVPMSSFLWVPLQDGTAFYEIPFVVDPEAEMDAVLVIAET